MECRKWGHHDIKSQVNDLIISHNQDMFFILETNFNSVKAQDIIKKLHMPNYVHIPPEAYQEDPSGGIWLLWEYFIGLNLQIVSTNKGMLLLNNRYFYKVSWFGTFRYGLLYRHLEKIFGNKFLIFLMVTMTLGLL